METRVPFYTVDITAQGGCLGLDGVAAPPRDVAESVLQRLALAARHCDAHLQRRRRRQRQREAPAHLHFLAFVTPYQICTSSRRGTDPFSTSTITSILLWYTRYPPHDDGALTDLLRA